MSQRPQGWPQWEWQYWPHHIYPLSILESHHIYPLSIPESPTTSQSQRNVSRGCHHQGGTCHSHERTHTTSSLGMCVSYPLAIQGLATPSNKNSKACRVVVTTQQEWESPRPQAINVICLAQQESLSPCNIITSCRLDEQGSTSTRTHHHVLSTRWATRTRIHINYNLFLSHRRGLSILLVSGTRTHDTVFATQHI